MKKRVVKDRRKKEVLEKDKQKLSFLDEDEDLGIVVNKKSK